MTNEERAQHGMVYQLEQAWNAADGAAFANGRDCSLAKRDGRR
jgi:hypothetical protein